VKIIELLTDLRKRDIKLWVEDGRLRLNAPKGTLTPELKLQLSDRKEEIIEFLQAATTSAGETTPPIKPIPREGNLPLSFAQQRLWFLDQLDPGQPTYNIPKAIRLKGPLNQSALEQSFTEIVRRHEVLRTTFAAIGGEPVQVIAPPQPFHLVVKDFQPFSNADREAKLQALIFEEGRYSFDLAQGPLFRATLVQNSETDHVLLIVMHHIISDGWSMDILMNELETLYKAFSTGQPSPLSELSIQYADFAQWQKEWLQGDTLSRQLDYWKKQLGSNPPALNLPTDYPRPKEQTFDGASETLKLSPALTQSFRALSQQQGTTLFMTFMAAFKTLLFRYTGQDDILVGTPIANRPRAEVERLIGFFVNTLVMRSDLSGNPTFLELLDRVREVSLEAYAHQDLPFEKLVEELQPERDLSYNPLFQVMFDIQPAPTPIDTLPNLTIESLETDNKISHFDLSLSIIETEAQISVILEHNTNLFNRATISKMLEHFHILLAGIAANPNQRLSDLPLLSDAEKQRLLVEWNDTQVDYRRNVCLHQLFEAQVEKTPTATAVVFKETALTYQELNERANQLAHYLQSLGVEPETMVGICAERSVEMVVGSTPRPHLPKRAHRPDAGRLAGPNPADPTKSTGCPAQLCGSNCLSRCRLGVQNSPEKYKQPG